MVFFRDNNQDDQDRTDCKRTVSKDVNKMDLSWEEATAAADDRSSTACGVDACTNASWMRVEPRGV